MEINPWRRLRTLSLQLHGAFHAFAFGVMRVWSFNSTDLSTSILMSGNLSLYSLKAFAVDAWRTGTLVNLCARW